MRMAHLYPEQKVESKFPGPSHLPFPSHHEIHLREEEASALTTELQEILAQDPFGELVLLTKILRLLVARNLDYKTPPIPIIPARVTYSYPSGPSTTLQEVKGANAEIAKGEQVRWEKDWGSTGGRFSRSGQ